MKWLADHCIVQVLIILLLMHLLIMNFQIQTAPTFYAQGNNPQFRFMGKLFSYVNRLSHIFSEGLHIAPALILYNADAEWWGDCMLMQKPMRELMQHQIDFDIVPCDSFRSDAIIEGDEIVINKESIVV